MPQNNDNITNESSPTQQTEMANQEVQPSEIGFSDLQLDQCIQKDFLTASPFCPTCIIDENATPDDWRAPEYDEEVYLDKTKCEYVAVVEVKLGNILSSDVSPEEFLDEELQELSSKYITEAYEKYIEENPESEITFLQFFERDTPEIKNLYDEAVRKARDELQKSAMDSTGYITDTKNGKKQVNAFKNLLDWARDPDRIRIGIKSILDEND